MKRVRKAVVRSSACVALLALLEFVYASHSLSFNGEPDLDMDYQHKSVLPRVISENSC
jgi:hypothetical protein